MSDNASGAVEVIAPSWWRRVYWWVKGIAYRWLPHGPSNLETHAERELRAAGLFDEDSDYSGMLADAVVQLVKVFAKQGHSGFSASQTLKIFGKVAAFEPLCPLTGEDGEWNDVSEWRDGRPGVQQNKRCSHVFRDPERFDGRAYDINGRVFREPSGACYTGSGSATPIEFPYVPTTEYVNVDENGDAL